MSKLLEFLIENPIDNIEDEIIVSARLKDFPFKIKGVTSPQHAEYQKMALKIGKKGKTDFNTQLFNELVVLNHTVEPNFRDAESIKKAGCVSPEQFLYRSLLAGEVSELASQIIRLSGFDADINDEIEEAKNS